MEYARYLQLVAAHYNLPIQNETSVLSIDKRDSLLLLKLQREIFLLIILLWQQENFKIQIPLILKVQI